MLATDDFYVDNGYDEQLIPKQEDHHIQYTIEMAKLSIIRKLQTFGISLKSCQRTYVFQWGSFSLGNSVLAVG